MSNPDPWVEDRLGRKESGEHLIDVLLSRYEARKAAGHGSYILNIDASWGEGKTFFLRCLRADLQQRGHAVAYVNAWQDDHADDPLVTVMAATENALAPFFERDKAAGAKFRKAKETLGIVAGETAKQVGAHLLRLTTGIAVDRTLDALKAAGAIDKGITTDDDATDKASDAVWDKAVAELIPKRVVEHQRANEAADLFRTQTSEAIATIVEKGMLEPMFVFVDELDRCRPLYAIRLLEDLKHLFAIKGVVFVVATDSAQLAHSVKAIYGAEFEARKYLRRFFDRVFVFPEAKRSAFVRHLLISQQIDYDKVFFHTGEVASLEIIRSWADGYKLTNRDLEQCVEIISTFITSWNHEAKIEPVYLLILVWLFYARHEVDLDRNVTMPQHKDALSAWSQQFTYLDRNGTQEKSLDGSALLIAARAASAVSMEKVSEQIDNVFKAYLVHEFQVRYPGGLPPHNYQDKSFLSEYSSRVRNAGRVVD